MQMAVPFCVRPLLLALTLLCLSSFLPLPSARLLDRYGTKFNQDMATAQKTAHASAPNAKLPQMWEISTRPWLYSLSQKYNKNITKLSQVPMSEFQNIRDKGMDIVWLMGLWQLGMSPLNSSNSHHNTFARGQYVHSQELLGLHLPVKIE
jgi:hypothetical protein